MEDQNKEVKVDVITYTMPDGKTVELEGWSESDYEALSSWVRKRYMAIITELVSILPKEDQYIYINHALDYAVSLDYSMGRGRDFVVGSTYGSALAIFLLINNPPYTFEEFYKIIFPSDNEDIRVNGMMILNEMLTAVYPEEFGSIYKEMADEAFREFRANNSESSNVDHVIENTKEQIAEQIDSETDVASSDQVKKKTRKKKIN